MTEATRKTVRIEDIVVDPNIDPRLEERSADYIDRLVNASGKIPPIVIDQNNRVLDGIHRLRAYTLRGVESIEVEVEEVEDDSEALAVAASRNATHGNILSSESMKRIAIKLYKVKKYKQKQIAKILGTTEMSISRYLYEINKQIEADHREKVVLLYLEGITQTDIANLLSDNSPRKISQGTVANYLRDHMLEQAVEKYESGLDFDVIIASLKADGFKGLLRPNKVAKIQDHLDEHIAKKESEADAGTDSRPPEEQEDASPTEETDASETQERVEAESDVDEDAEEKDQDSKRIHVEMQYKLLQLGTKMDLKVWVASDDRSKSFEGKSFSELPAMLSALPTNVRARVPQSSERIDVLWLENHKVVAAFEVEHSTSIDSGLLRMSDMSVTLDDADILTNIVAPSDRLEEVRKKLNRPTYKKIGLTDSCKFISYDDLANKFNEVMNTAETHGGWKDLLHEIAFKL